jgi:hypothetical protein
MRSAYWKAAVLMGLVVAACFVPTLEDLDEAKARECDAEHACLGGYACVEGHCQPEEGTACRGETTAACGLDTGECQSGTRSCGEDGKYGACVGAVQPMVEVCNGKDDDCDGRVDEDLSCTDGGDTCAACTAVGRTCNGGLCGRCLDGYFEEDNDCILKRAAGASCTRADTCDSGYCVDGFCCGSACTGPCEQCTGTLGTCTPLEDGEAGDPSCTPYLCGGSGGNCPVRCTGSEDCAPGVACINNRCGDKLPVGEACTTASQCASGNCVGGFCCGVAACETPTSQCHQPVGACTNGTCAYTPKSAGSECDDGNSCTVNDVCDGSGTCAGNPMSCMSPPNECHQSAGTCTNGACIYPPKTAGTACSDGDACTKGDVCNGTGACGGSAVVCTNPPTQCHQAIGTCSGGTCTYALKPAGAACNDGNACTVNDACAGEKCAGTALVCNTPPDQCYESAGSCANGSCTYTPKPAGAACNDGNACTVDDQCNGMGVCVVKALSCNDPPTQCHQATGSCSNGACSYALKPMGTACNDGDLCTDGDICGSTGVCTGSARSCNSPPNQCHQSSGSCFNGVCNYNVKPSGSACSDNNKCTEVDSCNGSGVCVSGGEITCRGDWRQCVTAVGCHPNMGCLYESTCPPETYCDLGICVAN